jgi:hypothetical protein
MDRIFKYFYRRPEKALTLGKTMVISFFFGLLGVDRLLMGYKLWWLKPLTFGGMWVWYFIDLYLIAIGKLKMADGRELV